MMTQEAVLVHSLSAFTQSDARRRELGIVAVTPNNFRNVTVGRRFHRVTILCGRVFSSEQLSDLRCRCTPDALWLE